MSTTEGWSNSDIVSFTDCTSSRKCFSSFEKNLVQFRNGHDDVPFVIEQVSMLFMIENGENVPLPLRVFL